MPHSNGLFGSIGAKTECSGGPRGGCGRWFPNYLYHCPYCHEVNPDRSQFNTFNYAPPKKKGEAKAKKRLDAEEEGRPTV